MDARHLRVCATSAARGIRRMAVRTPSGGGWMARPRTGVQVRGSRNSTRKPPSAVAPLSNWPFSNSARSVNPSRP